MRYVRAVDFAAFPRDAYGAQFLYVGESAIVIASNVPVGAAAPPQHVHPVDQLYYVTRGVMHVQLGSEVHVVEPDTLVFIPAGTPHHNWNEGAEDEFHFEVLAPTPPRRVPLLEPTDRVDLGDHAPLIIRSADRPAAAGVQRILTRADGARHMSLSVATLEAAAEGPPLHLHDVDQFYFVLDGELTVRIGLDEATAGPHTLVVLPAGVPHAPSNANGVPARHISLVAPQPERGDGAPARIAVELTAR